MPCGLLCIYYARIAQAEQCSLTLPDLVTHKLTEHTAGSLRSAPANTRSSHSHRARSSALASARAALAFNGADDLRPRFVACSPPCFRFAPPDTAAFAKHAWHRRASSSARSAFANADKGCEALQMLQRSRTAAVATQLMQVGSSFFCSCEEKDAFGRSSLHPRQRRLEPRHMPHLRTGLLSCFFEKYARGFSLPQPLHMADGSIALRGRPRSLEPEPRA